MPDNTPKSDQMPDPDRWVDVTTASLGMLFGVLLVLMGLDTLRRMRDIEREYDTVSQRGLTVVQGGSDDAA